MFEPATVMHNRSFFAAVKNVTTGEIKRAPHIQAHTLTQSRSIVEEYIPMKRIDENDITELHNRLSGLCMILHELSLRACTAQLPDEVHFIVQTERDIESKISRLVRYLER